ncbi:MAG: hypothetical protein BAJALOKI3v1_260012 [Promethearchaeota archaeon]|nr:MAG: hypothetical protein BAJALOKI3v1_260012 [Candidatus Lokiarchaeota archaeon]
MKFQVGMGFIALNANQNKKYVLVCFLRFVSNHIKTKPL